MGLSTQQILDMQAEGRAFCAVDGYAAQKAVLERARTLGRRHRREAARLSRLAACIEEELGHGERPISAAAEVQRRRSAN